MSGARARIPQQRKSDARPVAKPQDRHEHEAERAGDVVARGGSVAGWSFTTVSATPVQRQEVAKPKSDDDKKKEALEKAGEAALETPQGKAIKDKVLADPLVKTVKDAVTSTPGMIGTGLAAAGGVAALGAAKKPLPFQPPAIPLDKVTPGLSAQVRLDGPVNAPTFVGLTLTYKEQGPKGKPTAKSDEIAKETAALRAQQDMFKPASQKLAEQKEADDMVQAYIRSQKLTIPLTPGGKQEDVPKKDDAKKDEPKKEEDKPVQRAPASSSGAAPAHANVDGALSAPGRPLDASARRSMEARFGRDFSNVRVHDDARAAATAQSIDAAAFTVGEDVVFAPGRFDTTSAEGRRLLAHELAHVVQQRSAGRALEARHRAFFEPRLDTDLGAVRIHTDAAASASASDVKARAYTLGKHVVFGRGHYAPDTPRGRWLLAHELAHVAQAGTAAVDGTKAVERDASDAATETMRGRRARVRARRNRSALNLFGEPDNVPDLTFVSTHETATPGFLAQAVRYHDTWGLHPQRFDSMQGLLATLAQSATAISRLRIVSHANFDNIFTPLFDGGAAGIKEEDLRAYAESDVAGLRQTLGGPLVSDPADRERIVDLVRTSNPSVLKPFGLDQPGSTATGAVALLVEASVDLFAVRSATGKIAAKTQAALDSALTTELTEYRSRVQQQPPTGAGVKASEAQDLQDAITGITTTGFAFKTKIPAGQDVEAATSGLGQNFRTNLQAVRKRLTSSSWVDIRGCRVGQHPTYLAAVAKFFGSDTAKPHVSGPNLFQSYPKLGWHAVKDADVRRQFADADVRHALDYWAGVTGLRERFLWWLRFLGIVLQQEAQRVADEQKPASILPPSLSGGLKLQLDPFLALDFPNAPLPTLPQLQPPTLTPPRPKSPFAVGTLRNPLVDTARREIPKYSGPDGCLRYYLDAGLPLPVQRAANVQNIALFFKEGKERDAINAWLTSEWASTTPGLSALEAGDWKRDELRLVEAVSKLTADRSRTTEMYVSPDPRYDEHIKKT